MHRYLDPLWISRRLTLPAEHIFAPTQVIRVRAMAEKRWGEPEITLLDQLVDPGRCSLDVGAAEGVYTWFLTNMSAKCIAFEPNPCIAKKVQHRVPGADVRAMGLSDVEGVLELRIPVKGGRLHCGHATVESANALIDFNEVETVQIDVRPLDSLQLPQIGFVKIDVEGHELAVISGGKETLAREHPVILVEIEERHRPGALPTMARMLAELGYGSPEQYGSENNFVFHPA